MKYLLLDTRPIKWYITRICIFYALFWVITRTICEVFNIGSFPSAETATVFIGLLQAASVFNEITKKSGVKKDD